MQDMTKSRPNVTTKPTYKAPRKALATRAVEPVKPSSPKSVKPSSSDWHTWVLGQLALQYHNETPELPRPVLVETVQEKLTSFHTLFNLSVDPDFINTPDAINLLQRSIELHIEFTKGFELIFQIVNRYVAVAKKGPTPKRKGKTTGLEARPNAPSSSYTRSTKRRSQICLSDSSALSDTDD